MQDMKTYQDCLIHPNSDMHKLMEIAQKTNKPEDHRKVSDHYTALERVFRQQCALSNDKYKTRWAIGKP